MVASEGAANVGVNVEAVMLKREGVHCLKISISREMSQQQRNPLAPRQARLKHRLPNIKIEIVIPQSMRRKHHGETSKMNSQRSFCFTMVSRIRNAFKAWQQTRPSTQSPSSPLPFPNLIIERLYYAEGRHHPDHPLHGQQTGLAHW